MGVLLFVLALILIGIRFYRESRYIKGWLDWVSTGGLYVAMIYVCSFLMQVPEAAIIVIPILVVLAAQYMD